VTFFGIIIGTGKLIQRGKSKKEAPLSVNSRLTPEHSEKNLGGDSGKSADGLT